MEQSPHLIFLYFPYKINLLRDSRANERRKNKKDSSASRDMNRCECQPLLLWKFSSCSAYFRPLCLAEVRSSLKHTPFCDSMRETTEWRKWRLRPTPRKAGFALECHCAWLDLLQIPDVHRIYSCITKWGWFNSDYD